MNFSWPSSQTMKIDEEMKVSQKRDFARDGRTCSLRGFPLRFSSHKIGVASFTDADLKSDSPVGVVTQPHIPGNDQFLSRLCLNGNLCERCRNEALSRCGVAGVSGDGEKRCI